MQEESRRGSAGYGADPSRCLAGQHLSVGAAIPYIFCDQRTCTTNSLLTNAPTIRARARPNRAICVAFGRALRGRAHRNQLPRPPSPRIPSASQQVRTQRPNQKSAQVIVVWNLHPNNLPTGNCVLTLHHNAIATSSPRILAPRRSRRDGLSGRG